MAKKKLEKKEILDKKQQRIDDCTKAVNKTLDQYGCTLSAYVVVTAKGNFPKVQVISK